MQKLKIKIRKGDNVIVNAGKDNGKKGKILRVINSTDSVIIEGVGEVKKRRKPKKSNEKGQVVNIATPIHVSNVSLYCSNCGKGVRTGVKMEGSKKVRICTKCKGII